MRLLGKRASAIHDAKSLSLSQLEYALAWG